MESVWSCVAFGDECKLLGSISYTLNGIGKVKLHRYICLWRASKRKLEKKRL